MKNFETKGNAFLELVKIHLFTKERISNTLAWNVPKTSDPLKFVLNLVINSASEKNIVKAIANYVKTNLKYISDPLNGSLDYYTHPYSISQMINTGVWDKSCDCDDYATFSVALYLRFFKGLKDKQSKATVVTIIPDLIKKASDIQWSHVIAVFWLNDKVLVIDTNGLSEFETNENKAIVEKKILEHFSRLYKTNYVDFIDHGYPFNEP